MAIEEAQSYGSSDANAELAESLVRVEAATDAQLRAMNPINATDSKRQRAADLGDGQSAARVTVQRDVYNLEDRRQHKI